ncbi:hypothetical protein VTO42DRAFT_2894 [Malbranchea cinnamomea]
MDNPPPLPPEVAAEDKGPRILWSMWSLTIAATVFVAARLYVRVRLLKKQGLDDYLIILSMACAYIYAGFTTASVKAGNGRHTLAIDPNKLERALMLNMAGFPAGVLSFCIPKLAVVALLQRILNPSRRHKIFLWSLTLFTTLYLSFCFIVLYIQCDPPRALWDQEVMRSGNFKCWDSAIMVNLSIAGAALSAAVDMYLAIYPATVLWKLQMHWRKKLGLSIALGFGGCACAISIYKCTKLPSLGDKLDSTYTTADLVIWACVEGNTLVIAACIPTLAPLFEFMLGRKFFASSAFGKYTIRKNSRSNNAQGLEFARMRRQPAKNPDTKLGALDSQVSILAEDEQQRGQDSHSGDSYGVIQRTDHISVEFGPKNGGNSGASNVNKPTSGAGSSST